MDDKESVAQPINISTEPKDTLSEKSGAIKKCVEEYLKITCPKVAFVYTSPKVGSTALVSSFRIFASKKINIFHFHGNHLLPQEYKLAGVTINDLICYCDSVLKKRVYVIDVYRSPIEKKCPRFLTDSRCIILMLLKRWSKIFPWNVLSDDSTIYFHILEQRII